MRRQVIFLLVLWMFLCLGSASLAAAADRNLVYIRVANDQGPALAAAGVTLTAEIAGGFLALVPTADLARLAELAPDHKVLAADDPRTDIFVRYARNAVQAIEPLTAEAEILYREADFAIMRLPTDQKRRLPPLMDTQRVFRDPLRFVTGAWEGPAAASMRTANPDIEDMVAAVTQAWIVQQVETLQDFGNRHSYSSQGELASYWIRDQFLAYGYEDVTLQSFNNWNDNVVCVKPGTVSPERHVVVGGHYDSIGTYSNPYDAPGADDNATGTVGVLAAAMVMAPYDFEYTVVFIAFNGEEQGLYGSRAWANSAATAGLEIEGAIIMDMLGHRQTGDQADIDIIFNTDSQPLRTLIDDVIALYVPLFLAVDGSLPFGASSDHASFWNAGYRAILFFEDSTSYSPYIHSSADLIGPSVNDFAFMLNNVRTAVAATAVLARPDQDLTPGDDLPPPVAALQAHPNPFNPQTLVSFTLPRGGYAELDVYCARGRLVDRPLAGRREAGAGSLLWQADGLASGLYVMRLRLDGEVLQTVKLTLVR